MKNAERLTDAEKDSIHPLNILPKRPCTAHFSFSDKDTSLSQVFDDLKSCGIGTAAVRCLQRNPNGFVSVTFYTSEYRDLFLLKPSFLQVGTCPSCLTQWVFLLKRRKVGIDSDSSILITRVPFWMPILIYAETEDKPIAGDMSRFDPN